MIKVANFLNNKALSKYGSSTKMYGSERLVCWRTLLQVIAQKVNRGRTEFYNRGGYQFKGIESIFRHTYDHFKKFLVESGI